VWVDVVSGTSGTAFPQGTPKAPVNNLADAKTIADRQYIERIHIHGDATMNQTFEDYLFVAHGTNTASIDLNGQTITGCRFERLGIIGPGTGHFNAVDCELLSGFTGINANLENCIVAGTFTVAAGQTFNADRCTSPTGCVVNLNGDGVCGFANFSGIITAMNMTNAAGQFGVTGYYILNLLSSLTAGNVFVAGVGIINDSSAGATVTERTLPSTVWDELTAAHTTAGTFGQALLDAVIVDTSTAQTGSTTTSIRTTLSQADGFFDGMFVMVKNSAGLAVRKIDEYKNTNGELILDSALPFTPGVGDEVQILTSRDMGRTGLN
jgi:hypothetical protein